ncbi:TRAP transporter small permease subunit [Marinimicrobium sp. LS-A18]|uniref:TRAP transporter small permease subunit n=1 Tax=Marinimicrobium sp. LS-A18 TaxID=1381596 RepID=UPI00046767CB|nr:TRAP transporter small permease subunit [Marinimicrobium sp. LS-A18]
MPEDTQTPKPLAAVRALIRALDACTEGLGRTVAWLAPVMVVITCTVVLLRYGLGQGSVALQESVTYMHAALFMLGAGYALKYHKQVRVDILYRRFSPEGRAWVDALGSLVFLIPLAIFIGWISQDFVRSAWRIREVSADSGGLPWVYLLKSLIPLLAVTLLLQAVAEVLRNLLRLMGYPAPDSAPTAEAGEEEC